jgi:hypothetical protein
MRLSLSPHPQLSIIAPQNPEPVVARFGFDLLFINREMMIPLNFQIATVTLVSDQTLVPLAKLLL